MTKPKEDSLDPADWNEFRRWAHLAMDDAIDFLRTARERPAWQPVPDGIRAALNEALPQTGKAREEVYEQFRRWVLPYPTGNIHPRFWGWVMGTGTPDAMVAELLASAMNSHVAGYDQSAALVEERVLAWLAELLGFPPETSGVLVGGGTMANLLGLAVARNARAGFDVRSEGLSGAATLTVYASHETHHWLEKSCEVLGLGRRAIRRIPCDEAHRVDLRSLAQTITRDRAAGARPVCVVGNAGTVNVGAIDDLQELAEICRREGLWFHIDGAFGALAALSPALRARVRGIDQADSVAFDLHKWGYLPYGVGGVLVRDAAAHRAAFASRASYIASVGRGMLRDPFVFADRGIELSRSFRALKVWMALKTHGAAAWARLVEQNVAQAEYLAARIRREPRLELMAPVPLNVVCFRVRRAGLEGTALDAFNEEILVRLQESGVAVVSTTRLEGQLALRAAITNHRTRQDDLDVFVDALLNIATAVERDGLA
jgi:glutamate/tyrosine decarboxylase-like PLP-dependent enzyme